MEEVIKSRKKETGKHDEEAVRRSNGNKIYYDVAKRTCLYCNVLFPVYFMQIRGKI